MRLRNGHYFGKLMIIIGLIILIPILIIPFYLSEVEYISSFATPGFISIVIGFFILKFADGGNRVLSSAGTARHGSMAVLLIWLYAVLFGALPFFLSGQLRFIQSIFEAVSGWTTTGLSVVDVESSPKIFLFYRAFMQYCGGLGFMLMMISIVQEQYSMFLYTAEGHPDMIRANIKKTGRTITSVYIAFLLAGTAMYALTGIGIFDSILNTMCSLSTGGFSTQLNSIGSYDDIRVSLITVFLMLIGTTNFAVLVLILKNKYKRVLKVSELRFMIIITLVSVSVLTIALYKNMDMSFGESLERALVDGVSAFSTTGFSTMSYKDWPQFAIGVLILLMVIGGGIGSTAGGIKMGRIYIMFRIIAEEFKYRVSSKKRVLSSYYCKADGKVLIDEEVKLETMTFILAYIVIYITGSLMLTITSGCTITEGMFEFASSLSTVGLSIGITDAATNNATLIVEIIGMLLGRLEIFVVLTGIYSIFRKVADRKIV